MKGMSRVPSFAAAETRVAQSNTAVEHAGYADTVGGVHARTVPVVYRVLVSHKHRGTAAVEKGEKCGQILMCTIVPFKW